MRNQMLLRSLRDKIKPEAINTLVRTQRGQA